MNEQRDKQFVQYAINALHSSIQGVPALTQKIMHQKGAKPVTMKGKYHLRLF